MFRLLGLLVMAAAAAASMAVAARADEAQIARGKYLVSIAGCNDCHTPGYFLGKADEKRFLGGSDVGFEIPGLGVFVPPNLTPDKKTGIGSWTVAQIVHALQTGEIPNGRMLAPIMPWSAYRNFTKYDATAIALYLKTLKPVHHQVPGPFKPGEKVSVFTMRIVPPGAIAAGAAGETTK